MTQPLQVTVVGDDELTVCGLRSMLGGSPDIELVRLARPLVQPVDIALFDHAVSGSKAGRPTLAQLVADARIRKVVLFTWNFQPWSAPQFLDQGAAAYLPKSLTGVELVAALHAVHTDRRLVAVPERAQTSTNTPEPFEILTRREAQILSLICRGLTNTDIARRLTLSPNTVKSYIRTCYRKIDVETRSRAVLWGLGHGFGSGQGAGQTSEISAATVLAERRRA